MPRSAPFRLNRSGVMLAVISAAFASEAGAIAGRTEFTIGGVTVARNGVERPLARGTELDSGDVIRTNNGRAQIRFTDGSYVSLQPNTEFGIREYRYENKTDGSERGFFGLLKGAMRTVTGAIGRFNRDRYQITTPTATVGIRGTGGVIQVLDDGSTLVIGTSGIWSLTNPAGSVDVPAGNSAVAPTDPNQPPQETTQQPTSGPAPLPEEEPQFVQGEERTATGDPVLPSLFTPLVSGDGYAAALAYTTRGPTPQLDGGEFGNFASASAVFNAAGQLTSITDPVAGLTYSLGADGMHAPLSTGLQDFGSDGILAWGRWINTVNTTGCSRCQASEFYTPNQGFHYVVGMPTSVMPSQGTGIAYTQIGATAPTYADGRSAPGTFTGSLSVTFSALTTVDGTFAVAMPDGKGWEWSASNSTSGSFFELRVFQGQPITGIGGACSGPCTCSATVRGFFSGATAERAGISYHIQDSSGSPSPANVLGAAAFKKN